jgi:short-subunit dehydrogenase
MWKLPLGPCYGAFMYRNVLIVGGSRGLGQALARHLRDHLETVEHLTVVSRKPTALPTDAGRGTCYYMDMSRAEDQDRLCALISEQLYDLVVYCAGGGPHGPYATKDWKDHAWSLQVGLLAPMKLVSVWLKARQPGSAGRFIIVGSRIAEQSPDPGAASYAAGKHGIMGFVSSLQAELEENQNKVWLFSPGYMDTDLLPKTAKVRHDGSKLMNAETAAQACLRWIKKDGPWHRVLN